MKKNTKYTHVQTHKTSYDTDVLELYNVNLVTLVTNRLIVKINLFKNDINDVVIVDIFKDIFRTESR